MTTVSVFAPASVANFGVGFDVLGAALDGEGDVVTARLSTRPGVRLLSITGDGGRLPLDAALNTAAVAAARVLETLGRKTARGLDLTLAKGLPLSSGMGSSAASAAAGALAAGRALGVDDKRSLLQAALEGEHAADGAWHGDNVFASLLGGFLLVPHSDPRGPLEPVSLRVPARLRLILVQPDLRLATRRARAVLPKRVAMALHTSHAGALARFVVALSEGDLAAAGACLLADELVDPRRLPLVRGGRAALDALLRAGAHGACLAGAGPALVALTEASADSERMCRGAERAWRRAGVTARAGVHRIDTRGARVLGGRRVA